MSREEVFKIIDLEREYQESMKTVEDHHIVEDFPLAAAMEAIRYNLTLANSAWYGEQKPYTEAMSYIRKIAAICVQMGEQYGMPQRIILTPDEGIPYGDDAIKQ